MNTPPWTLCYTFFRSLELAHLERSLFSWSRQTIQPTEAILFDNNTRFTEDEIKAVVAMHFPLEKWKFVFDKHGDPTKTASYCHNKLIEMVTHDTFILGRADLIQDPVFCARLLEAYGNDWMNFAASYMFQMPFLSKAPYETVDHAADLEPLNWRQNVRNLLQNKDGATEHKGPDQDSAGFCMSKRAWKLVGGYDESLSSWGFWQMDFQNELARHGVHFRVVPEFLTYHMLHQLVPEEGDRAIAYAKAHEQWKNSHRRKMKEFQ